MSHRPRPYSLIIKSLAFGEIFIENVRQFLVILVNTKWESHILIYTNCRDISL